MTDKHRCDTGLPGDLYGSAIDRCVERDDGTLWVDNEEYASQVNFCPYCGYKARACVPMYLWYPMREETDMTKTFEDDSIMCGVVEFETDGGTKVRAMDEGGMWGVYLLSGNAYIRNASILRNENDKPLDIWMRYCRIGH